ncbi:uncharacterized protein LOC125046372 [Penaeus chinensis]|uniref:uncharacterized protein LOC125046372 n=1 Tax=Penaeus chinensis TaxID=139456 RepID=UPI001FB7A7AE|nr:uncharacterized protein LOC125046372 [Penaeus chinensis]
MQVRLSTTRRVQALLLLPLVLLAVAARVSAEAEEPPSAAAEQPIRHRSATFIPNVFPDEDAEPDVPSTDENTIGQSPCPRGESGAVCRQELASSTFNCTTDACMQCRDECSSMEPSLWPLCCRDHFLCCRPLASACQQCDTPELFPFCGATFKRCN